MADINRAPDMDHFHRVHNHVCPNCKRRHTCNCGANYDKKELVCKDCEHGNYNPMIHGGQGDRSEA